jgi:membrane protease YdiL (CAAX protease family)
LFKEFDSDRTILDYKNDIMKKLFLLLFSRLFLFLIFQILLALFLTSWEGSIKYWALSASLTNITGIVLLAILYKQENISFFSIFRFQKANLKGDFLWFLLLLLISVPIAIIPSLALSKLLWGNTEYYHQVLFQPLNPTLVYCLLFVYPITTGLAELTTYFGYIMPRLKEHFKSQWIVISLPVIAFSLQHSTLPLVFETKFIFFRGVMYLLFAFVYGIALYKRPSLLPWLAILQLLIYILPMSMLLAISQ